MLTEGGDRMLVLPVYDLLLLPGVTFNFKKDVLERMQVDTEERTLKAATNDS